MSNNTNVATNLHYDYYAGTKMATWDICIAKERDRRGFSTGLANIFGFDKDTYITTIPQRVSRVPEEIRNLVFPIPKG